MNERSNGSRSWTTWVAAAVALTLVTAAWAQSRQVMVTDDGSGPAVMHFTMPDFSRLRTPDYERRDLPVFTRTLELDEDQQATIEMLLELYLEEYAKAAQELLPPPPPQVAISPIQDADGPQSIDGIVLGGLEGGVFDPSNLDVDVSPAGVAVRVGAAIGGPPPGAGDGESDGAIAITIGGGDDGEGAMPAGVFIAVDGPEGQEIPPEVIEQLEARAAEIAEKIKEQMERGEMGQGLMGHGPERMAMHQMRMEEMAARAADFKTKRSALRQRFETDVRVQLEPAQLDRWPVLERTLTRQKSLPHGRLDGERTDLVSILDRLELTPAPDSDLATTVRDYEVVLHEALKRRDATVETSQSKVDEAIGLGEHAKALQAVDRATQTRITVRNTNDQFAQAIAAQLPRDSSQKFLGEVNRLSFPRVYRTTRGEKAYDAVLARADLDPKLRAVVEDLQRAYVDELAIVNENIRRDIMRFQPDESRRAIEHIAEITQGGGHAAMPTDPLKASFDKRRALDERYIKYIRDMLPEEMATSVPELQPRQERKPVLIERIWGEEPQ